MRDVVRGRTLALLFLVGSVLAGLLAGAPAVPVGAAVPSGFAQSIVFTGLGRPTNIEFASDGTVFITEKRGRVLRFDSVNDPTPSVVADRRSQTHNNSDRGMLGLAVHPDYPATPWVYVSYALDQEPGGDVLRQFCPTFRIRGTADRHQHMHDM